MKKTSKLKNVKENTNVEFGMEFGDMNASKLYEIPFMNQEKAKKEKKSGGCLKRAKTPLFRQPPERSLYRVQ